MYEQSDSEQVGQAKQHHLLSCEKKKKTQQSVTSPTTPTGVSQSKGQKHKTLIRSKNQKARLEFTKKYKDQLQRFRDQD